MDPSAYLDLFVAEAREHLGAAWDLASRVDAPGARDAGVRDLFRHVHSVKGMAASMGFGAMCALAHDAESLMDRLREGRLEPTPATRQVLCATLTCLERMVESAARRQQVDDVARPPLQADLRRILAAVTGSTGLTEVADGGGSLRPPAPRDRDGEQAASGCVKIALIVRRDLPFPAVQAAVALGKLARLGSVVRVDPPMAALRTGRFDGRLLVTLVAPAPLRALAAKVASLEEIDSFTLVPAEAPAGRPTPKPPGASLRVSAGHLDAVLEDVLDLMASLGRAQAALPDRDLAPTLEREIDSARVLARRAYDRVIEMRLVPFEVAASLLTRVAQDLGARLGKTVALEIEGQDIRMDRSLLETLSDPLLHMARNAIDHGLESPEERRQARKKPTGRLQVRLVRHGSGLRLTVEDDGRGLDPRRLKQAAIEKGLMSPGEAVRLSDAEALRLILRPGFSTAAEADDVSGRGVGMDVVHAAVESIGGRLRIAAAWGRGTRFELTLPASVALIQSYLIRSAGALFAVPLTTIGRIVSMDDQSTSWRNGRRYWSVGGEEIAVDSLRALLGLDGPADTPAGAPALLYETGRGITAGIEVDEIVGRREIIVRPLPGPLAGLAWYSGAAVLDDGSIVPVLDAACLLGSPPVS